MALYGGSGMGFHKGMFRARVRLLADGLMQPHGGMFGQVYDVIFRSNPGEQHI